MQLKQFERIIGRRLIVQRMGKTWQRAGKTWRCYFNDVMYAEKPGPCPIVITIIGAGPNQERMRQDFVQKIRGKVARVYDSMGAYTEYPVPVSLTV